MANDVQSFAEPNPEVAQKESGEIKVLKTTRKTIKRLFVVFLSICAVLVVCGGIYGLIHINHNKAAAIDDEDIVNDDVKISIGDYVGYWSIREVQEKELTIHHGDAENICFSLRYDKAYEIKDVNAQLSDNIASFSVATDGGVIKGTLTFEKNTIIVEITQSTLYMVPIEIMKYTEQHMMSWIQSKEEGCDVLGHRWLEATSSAPKTCEVCGITEGDKLQVQPVYINELGYQYKYGKVYYHDTQPANYTSNTAWWDLNTPGHLQQLVCDAYGKTFTYGIHMDGDQKGPYYITYALGGKYTMFSGWCVLPDYKAVSVDALTYSKYFEVYCDGKLVFTSNAMRDGSASQYFEIDVTDVEVLTIQYAATDGPNDLAVLCDGLLS